MKDAIKLRDWNCRIQGMRLCDVKNQDILASASHKLPQLYGSAILNHWKTPLRYGKRQETKKHLRVKVRERSRLELKG